jgi:hypothetical protein
MMVLNMMNLAQFERKQTSERVSINFHARALRGLRNGGMSILGYDQDPTNPSRLVINESEAVSVRKVFCLFLEEGTLSKTVTRLESEGIKPKFRPNRNERLVASGYWDVQNLRNLLRSQAYIGIREVNAKNKDKDQEYLRPFERHQIVKASWEPIVAKDIFQAVQDGLSHNLTKERRRLASGESRVYLLSGIIYCQDCGRPLVGSAGHGVKAVHRYYTHRVLKGDPTICSVRSIRANELEEKVVKHLDVIMIQEGYLDAIESRLEFAFRQENRDRHISKQQLEKDRLQIDREIRAAVRMASEMSSEGGIDALLKDTLIKLKSDKEKIEKQLLEIDESSETDGLTGQSARAALELNLAEYKRAKAKAKPAQLKRLVHKIYSAIVVGADGVKASYGSSAVLSSSNNYLGSVASDNLSEATGLSLFAKRRLMKIQDFKDAPPLPGSLPHLKVVGSYIIKNGVPDWNRTNDLQLRRLTLYPTELRAHTNEMPRFSTQVREMYTYDASLNQKVGATFFSASQKATSPPEYASRLPRSLRGSRPTSPWRAFLS